MSETRQYFVLRRVDVAGRGSERFWEAVGDLDAASPEEAIRAAIAKLEDGPGSDRFAVVAKRNWVDLPVAEEVQTTLRIGEREFAPEAS